MNYRYYFNRHSDRPFIWSVDQGSLDTEIKVRDVQVHKCETDTGYDSTVPPGDIERPRVYVNVRYATLIIRNGIAHFFHDPDWRKPKI